MYIYKLGFRIMIKTPSYVEENVFQIKMEEIHCPLWFIGFLQGHFWLGKMFWVSFVNNTFHRKTCFLLYISLLLCNILDLKSVYIQRKQCYELKRHDIGWDKILWVKLTRVDIRFNEVFVGYIVLFLTQYK